MNRGLLKGDIINANEPLTEKVAELVFQQYYLI